MYHCTAGYSTLEQGVQQLYCNVYNQARGVVRSNTQVREPVWIKEHVSCTMVIWTWSGCWELTQFVGDVTARVHVLQYNYIYLKTERPAKLCNPISQTCIQLTMSYTIVCIDVSIDCLIVYLSLVWMSHVSNYLVSMSVVKLPYEQVSSYLVSMSVVT